MQIQGKAENGLELTIKPYKGILEDVNRFSEIGRIYMSKLLQENTT